MMTIKLDAEIFDLIERLRQIQSKADAQSTYQCDLKEQLKIAEEKALALHPDIHNETNAEIFDLVKRLQQMQGKAEALTVHQHDLKEQLKSAEDKALELHQKIIEEASELGGES